MTSNGKMKPIKGKKKCSPIISSLLLCKIVWYPWQTVMLVYVFYKNIIYQQQLNCFRAQLN